MFAGNVPSRPVNQNRVMKHLINTLIERHPSPVKVKKGDRLTNSSQVTQVSYGKT
jgi:hypothetical protein